VVSGSTTTISGSIMVSSLLEVMMLMLWLEMSRVYFTVL
jgi:hypothetical protein